MIRIERPVLSKSNIVLIRKAGSWWVYLPRDVKLIMKKYGFDPEVHKLDVWITKIVVEKNKFIIQIELEKR